MQGRIELRAGRLLQRLGLATWEVCATRYRRGGIFAISTHSRATGVETVLRQFKRREVRCPYWGRVRDRWEEKQTDVGIAVRLMKLAAVGACERAFVVSGDADLVRRSSEARATWPARIGVAFPAGRATSQLRAVADWTVNLDSGAYARHQFPSVVTGGAGTPIRRPSSW